MRAELDRLILLSIQLQVQIWAAQERLAGRVDREALHDLRVALRRLRSLIRPFKRWQEGCYLDRAIKAVADQSSPLRDHEVLLQGLADHASAHWCQQTQAYLHLGYRRLLRSAALQTLNAALETWPAALRLLQREGEFKQLDLMLRRYLIKQADKLAVAIATPNVDRHHLRLLVKTLNYALEAYPQYGVWDEGLLPTLKKVQSLLGDWHDRWQWLQLAEDEPELQVFSERWQQELQSSLEQAELLIERLAPLLVHSSE